MAKRAAAGAAAATPRLRHLTEFATTPGGYLL